MASVTDVIVFTTPIELPGVVTEAEHPPPGAGGQLASTVGTVWVDPGAGLGPPPGMTGMVVCAAGTTVALLVIGPVVPLTTVPVTVYVRVPPTLMRTVSVMEPVPLGEQAVGPVGDSVAVPAVVTTQVQVAPVTAAGTGSVKVAATASLGPLLCTVTVYVMGWPGVLLMLLLWAGAIALILWGASSLFPTERVHVEDEALEIVRQRFARGEISREEFLQASETLRRTP